MTTDAEVASEVDETRMSLTDHLRELRNRIIKCAIAVALGAVIATFFYDAAYDTMVEPLCDIANDGNHVVVVDENDEPQDCALVAKDPLTPFNLRMKFAGYGGVALAMPVLLWQVWRFVAPGLYKREQRYAMSFVATSMVLFCLGAGLAFYTLPRALVFLRDVGGDIVPQYEPAPYFSLVIYMMLAFGIGFLFPIVLVFLQLIGVLTTARLRAWRRYAAVLIVVVVAVATPSGDPFSLFALSIPMYLFYEASIVFGWVFRRRRARAELKAGVAGGSSS